jgi:hypothetical protein
VVEIDAAAAARNEVGGAELPGSASVGRNSLTGPTNSGRSQFEHRNLQCSSLGTNVVSSSSDGPNRNSAPHEIQRIALRTTPTAAHHTSSERRWVTAYRPRIFATTRLKRPGAAMRSSCAVEAGAIGGPACTGMGSVSFSRPRFVKTKRRSTSWHAKHLKVRCSKPP